MTPLTILIVDDQVINRKLLAAQLEAEGHTVLAAAHGGDALDCLAENDVDVVISDILMPVMDGYRLCATIRTSERHRDLPFIFYTATYTSPADEELCDQLGANKYLRKPVGIREILNAIDDSVGTAAPRPRMTIDSDDILKEYSERLVFKLEQKNIELAATTDELRESERRFQSMLANLQLIAMTVDCDGRITYCNDHLLRLTGWTREELLGRGWFETFIPREIQDDIHQTFRALLADLPEAWHHENEITTRSGKRLMIQWNNTVLRSLGGEVIGAASIGEDVTERRSLEQQMLRAQRLESLGTLAGGIAHDLNNLLMPILMGVTLLKRFEISEPSRKAIENIERSVKRGSDLVKQVLLFARGAGTSRNAVQIADVVREIVSIAESTFPKNISFHISVPGDLKPVTGDTTQLTQVLLNLCVNARDAMPKGGQILISAVESELSAGPHVVLEVTDTGDGIPKENMDRIFDPFFTTKPIGKGTGLGLSTVQGIVANHGGFVTVASTLGEGTTFKIHIPPRIEEHAAVDADLETGAEPPRGHGELVMVVEDDSTILSMTTQTLTAFGYTVVGAEDGAQALSAYSHRAAEIALVVTDMSMPVIDGPAFVAALLRLDPHLPIIAVTGNIAADYVSGVERSGVACVLLKPYTADQLLRAVDDGIKGR
ncbi:MAG TPA: response regulator [Thermoanaerobaculia bacterium]|nr:response regulator [Thermoanaerobaculia bacterium]